MISSLPGYLTLAALAALVLAGKTAAWWRSRAFFASLLALTVLVAHAPLLFIAQELPNPDEALLMAAAMTLKEHFAPWLSIDTSTAGPLSMLPLLAAPDSYIFARWCAALCSAGAVTLGYLSLDDHPLVRAGALAVGVFFVFMQDLELFQFSTEHLAVVLLALAGWFWLQAGSTDRVLRPGRALAIGFCLGAAVLAKLQSAPSSIWLAGSLSVVLILDHSSPSGRRLAAAGALLAGCVTVPLFFVALAGAQSVLPDMIYSYGLNNMNYVGDTSQWSAAGYQPSLVWGLNYLLKPAGAMLLGGLLLLPRFSLVERRNALIALGGLAAAILAIVLPGRGSHHYWFYAFGPLLLALGLVLTPAWRQLESHGPLATAAGQRAAQILIAGLLLILPVIHRLQSSRDESMRRQLAGLVTVREAGLALRGLARPGDRLSIWGWRPELHAYSGLPQGARDSTTTWLILNIPLRDYYRRRFLADLAQRRPRFFADAVGPRGFIFTDRTTGGHEIFPELTALLAQHYDYLGETGDIRLYVRHAD